MKRHSSLSTRTHSLCCDCVLKRKGERRGSWLPLGMVGQGWVLLRGTRLKETMKVCTEKTLENIHLPGDPGQYHSDGLGWLYVVGWCHKDSPWSVWSSFWQPRSLLLPRKHRARSSWGGGSKTKKMLLISLSEKLTVRRSLKRQEDNVKSLDGVFKEIWLKYGF